MTQPDSKQSRDSNNATTSADASRDNFKQYYPSTINGTEVPRLRIQLKNEFIDRNKKTRNEMKDALQPPTHP